MLRRTLSLRVVGPTMFVSFLLLASCTGVAVYVFHQQTTTAQVYGENVGSRGVAHDLEVALNELLRLDLRAVLQSATSNEPGQVDPVTEQHSRITKLLADARAHADKPTESDLVGQLEQSFRNYLEIWTAGQGVASAADASGDQRLEAVALLDTETLLFARELREFNSQETAASQAAHDRTVLWTAWGLAGVGLFGSLAGVLLGYGVARGLRRSIYQLSVRVRDAADKLGQEFPPVTISDDGDLHFLHEQVKRMVQEIEQVVARLQQREREVLRADQMAAVGQIAAGVAHELRNPLTSVKMLVQKNRKQALGGPTAENLQVIEQEIRRMERCLQTFLDFARPPKLERRPLNLSSVVERTFTLIEGRARKQQVTLDFKHANHEAIVEADREQLQQLLINLALNSLDAMPHGGTLTFELNGSMDGLAELWVRDSGPGVSPEILPRLFEPFVSGKETGLGLGLVVSRRIAEDHGGTLNVYERPGGGACFVLRLPGRNALVDSAVK
jgi:two-component system, NtrC family, sensor histidine kinase HydH